MATNVDTIEELPAMSQEEITAAIKPAASPRKPKPDPSEAAKVLVDRALNRGPTLTAKSPLAAVKQEPAHVHTETKPLVTYDIWWEIRRFLSSYVLPVALTTMVAFPIMLGMTKLAKWIFPSMFTQAPTAIETMAEAAAPVVSTATKATNTSVSASLKGLINKA